jgi:site-specific DNA-methyltransferase (adenine-specific)
MVPVEIPNGIFYNGDCISGAKEHIPPNTIDLIITDPPYGINGDMLHQHYNRKEQFVVEGYVEVPESEYGEFSYKWIQEAERILRPGGSIFIVSGYTNLYHILYALRQTKLKEINHIIWKYNFGVYTSRKFVSSHYHILYYEKPGGERTFNLESRYGTDEKLPDGSSLNYQDREDVWIINREYKPGQIKNKNELPLALLIKMLQYGSNEGDLVCDLFLGGFSTAKTAIGLNRKAIGFEISNQMFETRIKEIKEIIPGNLLHTLRSPIIKEKENQGKAWTNDEIELLKNRFSQLITNNTTKKEAIKILEEELGRGRWSIEKALNKLDLDIKLKRGRLKGYQLKNDINREVTLSHFL